MADLWADQPDPKTGAIAAAGYQRLSDSILGNTNNLDGTLTHTSVLGFQTTFDPSTPKMGFFSTTSPVSTGTKPGSFAASIDYGLVNLFKPVTDTVQKVTDSADTMTRNVTDQLAASVSANLGGYVIVGLFALGAFMIVEGLL